MCISLFLFKAKSLVQYCWFFECELSVQPRSTLDLAEPDSCPPRDYKTEGTIWRIRVWSTRLLAYQTTTHSLSLLEHAHFQKPTWRLRWAPTRCSRPLPRMSWTLTLASWALWAPPVLIVQLNTEIFSLSAAALDPRMMRWDELVPYKDIYNVSKYGSCFHA